MEPYLRGVTGPRKAASTPSSSSISRLRASSRQGAQRRKAAPLGQASRNVRRFSVQLVKRGGAEGWIECRVLGRQERFYVKYDHWVGDLMKQVFDGGYWVEPIPPPNQE